jgi:hypothetical protein
MNNDITHSTKLLSVLENELQNSKNNDELIRYIKLESWWILINIAFGDDKVVGKILEHKYLLIIN